MVSVGHIYKQVMTLLCWFVKIFVLRIIVLLCFLLVFKFVEVLMAYWNHLSRKHSR